MNNLLGLNPEVLTLVGAKEKSAYSKVVWLLILTVLLSIISNGYFGFLFLRTWWGIALISFFMGFIHFSVLRISLITLLTKPLVEVEQRHPINSEANSNTVTAMPVKTASQVFRENIRNTFFTILRFFKFGNLLRFLFVGFIAITISVPISTFFLHSEAMRIEDQYRKSLLIELDAQQNLKSSLNLSASSKKDLQNGYYPFVVFRVLWESYLFRILVLFIIGLVFAPLILLTWIRNNKKFEYPEYIRQQARTFVLADYNKTLEDSQQYLDAHFPTFSFQLKEMNVHSDSPFNQKFKKSFDRKFGNSIEFLTYMHNL